MIATSVLKRHTPHLLMTLALVVTSGSAPLFGQLATRVKDINTSQTASSSDPSELVVIGNTVYFAANNGKDSNELWRSDGTSAGTRLVRDSEGIFQTGSNPSSLAKSNGLLFFSGIGTLLDRELWKSDGTATGTVQVKNLALSGSSFPSSMFDVNGTLFFTASDTAGAE